jgi:hypothetical protein
MRIEVNTSLPAPQFMFHQSRDREGIFVLKKITGALVPVFVPEARIWTLQGKGDFELDHISDVRDVETALLNFGHQYRPDQRYVILGKTENAESLRIYHNIRTWAHR